MASVDINDDLSTVFRTGKVTIGGAAVQLFPNRLEACKGVQFKAASGNANTIYIGRAGVTAGTADSTDGMFIDASEGFFVAINDITLIYAIADAAGQVLYWSIQ